MNLRVLSSRDAGFDAAFAQLVAIETESDRAIEAAATAIVDDVCARGDAALLEYTNRFDRMHVDSVASLEIPAAELSRALDALPVEDRAALEAAAGRVRAFHERQRETTWTYTEADGTTLGQRITPLASVGVYVPGGLAAYPSSVLMNVIPAQVAGVEHIVMVSPTPDGARNPFVLAAAALAGARRVFAIGGAQAVAALAYGTAAVPRVDKIVGPGNAYVAAAKRRVFGVVGIDMIAGPSEILIICDGKTDPDWIAFDLFSQAEHDELAQAILLTPDAAFIDRVQASIARLLPAMPRKAIIEASLRNKGALILTRDLDEACALADRIAPEHLEISTDDPQRWADRVRHAGAIFLGRFSSEALGDYCAGPNHVLPTARTARFSSPLGVYDFVKRTSLIHVSPAGAQTLGRIAAQLARGERLPAHAASAEARIKNRGKKSGSGLIFAMSAPDLSVIRDDVRAIAAYAVPDATGLVKLDAMENPYVLPDPLARALNERLAAVALNRYPPADPRALKAKLAFRVGVPDSMAVMLGNGSDELIHLMIQACARPGAVVCAPWPGFVMVELSAKFDGCRFVGVPLRSDFSLDLPAMLAAIEQHRPAVSFIAYPNNPTGNLFDRDAITAIIRAAAPGIVVLDEAYLPFARDTWMPQLARFPNLLVLRTLSKLGLAGIRLGYLAGHPAWIEQFDKLRPPYNVNVLTLAAADLLLEHLDALDAQAATIRADRERLLTALRALPGVTAFDSAANFILFRVADADRTFSGLKSRGILVKNVSRVHPLLAGCLRVTVGTPQENESFLAALKASL